MLWAFGVVIAFIGFLFVTQATRTGCLSIHYSSPIAKRISGGAGFLLVAFFFSLMWVKSQPKPAPTR